MEIDERHSLAHMGLKNSDIKWNLPVSELVELTLATKQGFLTDAGALMCDTGVFTRQAPKDKFIVNDELTEYLVWWGKINQPFSSARFDYLYQKLLAYLKDKPLYVNDGFVCAAQTYKLNVRLISEYPWHALFAHNLFLRLTEAELAEFKEDWLIISAPGFFAIPQRDGTNGANFTIINFTKKIIIIGGSAYSGEIKDSVFTVLNFLLPQKNVLPLHCSASVGNDGEVAVFVGLSSTEKNVLSFDPSRKLIGDDEHGWDDNQLFNFEGGCYVKCLNLTLEKQPQIFKSIKHGTILENTCFFPGSDQVNFADISESENMKAAYPIHYMENIAVPSIGKSPNNIFFLVEDGFGVIPPIAKLTIHQAMYHFISGYSSKMSGTETGIAEPTIKFSACFGEQCLPLHPSTYTLMLGEKLKKESINVWLVNIGWVGDSCGVGQRIPLQYTRALINATIVGEMNQVEFKEENIFGLSIPMTCPGVPAKILNPENSWLDTFQYHLRAKKLASAFIKNFNQYKGFEIKAILEGEPKISDACV